MAFSENIEISKSAEIGAQISIEKYLRDLEEDLREEIERITEEEPMLGEGKAAEVFLVNKMRRSQCDACIKIWRPHLEALKGQNPIEYAKIQTQEPEDEFKLQDALYSSGFTAIPRPIAYTETDGLRAMAMERIHGYTLRELQEKGTFIADPSWKELEKLLIELTKKHGVIHRDLHAGNIMIETNDDISKQSTISGKLRLIDLGLAKKIYGTPEPEDFQLTIGNSVVRYPQDKNRIEELKPIPGRPSVSVFTH